MFRCFWLIILLTAACAGQTVSALVARSGSAVLVGESPRLLVTGLVPGETVVVHSFRMARVYSAGNSQGSPVVAHALAEFVANDKGQIDIDQAAPSRGTYNGADPLGLLWSGEKAPTTVEVTLTSASEVLFRLERKSQITAETRITLTSGADRVEVEEVAAPGLNGVFARPRTPGPWPAIILLHGSEGGSTVAAQGMAVRFARLGYAAFGLNYFAYPYAKIEGVPQALVNIPVETIEKARKWLLGRPGVDAERVSLWGVSKGAELALLAASHYKWVDRVVACVPSSFVWAGFGRSADEPSSSWTIQGQPLPFIPYDSFEDSVHGNLSLAGVHERSLEKISQDRVEAARIPVEKTNAKLLLLGASRDQVWPSGRMARQIQDELRRAGRGDQVTTFVFEGASHFICGGGGDATRVNPIVKPEGNSPSPEASAHAAVRAWVETKRFLALP